MLESLREKISSTIDERQNLKNELYDRISCIENELVEFNEMLEKINQEDAFLKITAYEAFQLFDKLGYSNGKDKFDMYFQLVRNKESIKVDDKVGYDNIELVVPDNNVVEEEIESIEPKKQVNKYNNYEEKIETCKDELTKEQRKKLGKIVETLIEIFYDDNFYYYLSGVKISKFRVYYNLSILLSGKYKDEEIFDMIKTAFTYKTITEENKEKVVNELERIKNRI